MKKNRCSPLILLSALLLLSLPASAELFLETDKGVYNFGDEIVVNYELSQDQDFSGLMKLSLFCTGFDMEFYTMPTNVYAGEKQQVSVPPLSISPMMLGKCYVSANATSYDRSVNESGASNFFNVTSLLSVVAEAGSEPYLPGSTVEVLGRIGKSHSFPAAIAMSFLGINYASRATDNDFAYSIKLPKNIKAGKHILDFLVNDSYGNSGSASAVFNVEAVPTRIVNNIGKQSIRPPEPFGVSVLIYDQAGDLLKSDTILSVADSSGVMVISASNATGSNITLSFPQYQKPGSYTLTSSGLGLSASSQILVEEVEAASVAVDNKVAVLKNTGNVNYAREFNITLSGRKSYVVVHEVDLAPGESYQVDLTGTISEGNYNVSFPTVSEAPQVENVHIEDGRSALKKASDFIGITGRAVKVTGTGTGRIQAKFAPMLLFLIVGALGFYFIRNRGKGSSRRGNLSSGGNFGSSGKAQTQQISQPSAATEEDRVMQIIEEKRRQISEKYPQQPKSLRDDPAAQKFVRDIMKEKKFR